MLEVKTKFLIAKNTVIASLCKKVRQSKLKKINFKKFNLINKVKF